MCKSKFYVGKDELATAIESRKVRSFKNTPGGIRSMCQWAQKYSEGKLLHFCMEATGVYSQSLCARLYSLEEFDLELSVVNPARTHKDVKK